MATPANRVPVRIARGSKANLDTAIAAGDLKEGEICYATDENSIYVVEGGVLTQAGADLASTSIDALSDVDTTTVAPTDGQVLIWDNANSRWEPATLSDSYTDPLTTDGDIVIRTGGTTTRLGIGSEGQALLVTSGVPAWGDRNIQDAADFALNTGTVYEWALYAGSGGAAGSWGYVGTVAIKVNATDSNGLDCSSDFFNEPTPYTLYYTDSTGSGTVTVNSVAWLNQGTGEMQLSVSGYNGSGSGTLTLSLTDPNAAGFALTDGDTLEWNSTDSKFKPAAQATAASTRLLLGIEEYVDDAAAGTGGVASGALYYNTTSSDYRLKT